MELQCSTSRLMTMMRRRIGRNFVTNVHTDAVLQNRMRHEVIYSIQKNLVDDPQNVTP